jgi:hypothetical protein
MGYRYVQLPEKWQEKKEPFKKRKKPLARRLFWAFHWLTRAAGWLCYAITLTLWRPKFDQKLFRWYLEKRIKRTNKK